MESQGFKSGKGSSKGDEGANILESYRVNRCPC